VTYLLTFPRSSNLENIIGSYSDFEACKQAVVSGHKHGISLTMVTTIVADKNIKVLQND
jgi:hypothetical protein